MKLYNRFLFVYFGEIRMLLHNFYSVSSGPFNLPFLFPIFLRRSKGPLLVGYIQGSYGSWKTWKVLEFYPGIFQDWKVLVKGHWSWKVLEIC